MYNKKHFRKLILTLIVVFLCTLFLSCKRKDRQKYEGRIRDWQSKYGVDYSKFTPEYDAEKFPPKVILYSAIDTLYLQDTAGEWKKKGVDGFILNYVGAWENGPDYLDSQMENLKKANQACKKAGIKDNFYQVYLSRKNFPDWDAGEAEWAKFFKVFKKAVIIARDTGCRGIAIDTEPYQKKIWDMRAPQNKRVHKVKLSRLVRKRSLQMGEIIKKNFPNAVIMVFPEGSLYYAKKNYGFDPDIFELWEYFYQGLMDARHPGKILISTERTYRVTDPASIEKFITLTRRFYSRRTNPDYMKKHVSICPGAFPLGKTYKNKNPQYHYKHFEKQMRTFEKFSSDYVWIYGHGAAWWQIKDLSKYTKGRWIWSSKEQGMPCSKDIDEFYMVINPKRKRLLKEYYKQLQSKK